MVNEKEEAQELKKEEKKKEEVKQEKEEQKPEQAEEKKEEVKLSKKLKDIIDSVEKLNVLELSSLVKALEEKFGVSAQAMQVAAVGAPQAAGGGVQEEEKSTFNVILASVGDKKIQVIKEIRTITQLGLREAKDLVDKAPRPVKEGVSKEEAEKIKKQLEEQGATVELK